MFAVSMPNAATSAAAVETATKCFATAKGSPSAFNVHSRADSALASQYVALRTAKKFDEAREFSARLLSGRPEGRSALFEAAMARQYAAMFAALPEPAYLTYGNVDVPRMWQQYLKPGHHVRDGGTVELGGWTFGFVGGGLTSVYRTPYEMSEDEFRAK